MAIPLMSFLWEQLSWHEGPERIETYLLDLIECSANFIKFFLGLLYQFSNFLVMSSVSLKNEVAKWLSVIFAAQSCHKSNLVYHLVFSGSISLDQLRSKFQQQLLDFKDKWSKKPYNHFRYTWRCFMGMAFWQLEFKFDLTNHIKHYYVDDLEFPSPWRVEAIVDMSGRLAVMSSSEGTSPWELLLNENVITNEETLASVVLLRIHHVLTECQSTFGLMQRLIGISAPTPLVRMPQLFLTEQCIKTYPMEVKTPCDLNRLTIDSKEDIDACTRTLQRGTYVTFCTEQIPWVNIKRVAKKYGFPCNAVVYSNTIGAVNKLMEDFQQKLNTNIQRTPVHRLPHCPDELCNDCLPQNSVRHRALDLGETLLRLAGSRQPASVFNILLHLPEENGQGQVSFDYEGSLSFEPLEDSKTPGLVDIIPSCRVGQIGCLAVVVTTAGKLRIVLTIDKRIFNGSTATFYKYVNHGLQELLLKE